MNRAAASAIAEKLLSLIALALAIELVFFKFLPDIATGVIQGLPSSLTDFSLFRRDYLQPGTLAYTRFLGNQILWHAAQLISGLLHSQDLRLHPLRIAAGVLTPLYACVGAYPVLRSPMGLNWRYFMAAYAAMVLMSLYVFYPYDMPALALISVALYWLLKGDMGLTLVFMLLTGLFRETSFHVVTWVGLWMIIARTRPLRERVLWFAAFAAAFALEYRLLRHFYPGPVTGGGHILIDPKAIFLAPGMLSLTAICSLGLEAVFAILCLNRLSTMSTTDWRRGFFIANCWVLPGWWIFYRMMDGNMAEFRLLLPAVLPCVYGLAYAGGTPGRTLSQSGI
ncbi:MAG TPA: hypothetical protein VK700_09485 [Steroidobacteraceae bacterium]|jgi:hypothetical protein|nr:hypothetical protein [Steroidobacteraceae bacterium]